MRWWWVSVLCWGWPAVGMPSEPASADWTQRGIDPASKDGWAFRPLQTVAVPPRPSDGSNAIDAFLAAAQLSAGVTPNPEVDRRGLFRRLSFTLTGLPPSFAEVTAFVNDPAPDAVERCVDRLLASSHYGVRWSRHWLDIARFAESHGYEHDYDRLTAYHYRDLVVQALNADQPYDEFVRWQIAGDRLAPDNRLAWMATGFLAAGPHSTQITKREVERQRYDELDDIVSTIGTALLGLNIGCARCHDHPYDPIPQADFYRFAANFTRTVRSEIELEFDPDGYRAALATFTQQHRPYIDALTNYEATGLRAAYQQWRQRAPASALRPTWLLPSHMEISSADHPRWEELGDGSWRVHGPALKEDRYRLRFRIDKHRIAAIRLEALTDESMTHGGPGRDADGNFALSQVKISPVITDDLGFPAAPIARAAATFEQLNGEIAGTLDDRDDTAWGIDPQLGRHHAAMFVLKQPVDLTAEDFVQIELDFKARPQASIGRLRASFSEALSPSLEASSPPMPERVATALECDSSLLTKEDWDALTKWFAPQDAGWKRLDELRRQHAATAPQPQRYNVLVATEDRPAIRLHTQAAEEFLPQTEFLTRGDPSCSAGIASPGVLQALNHDGREIPTTNRVALAHWLTDPKHGAGALLARVIVNRLWQHHFGIGLVATPDDFGTRGSGPSHPELLEWLAGELIRHDWQLKPIHRLMVTSTAYRRAAASVAADPENRLFARWTSRRLEAEAIRDAILIVAGALDDRLDGPSERDPLHRRRSVYTFIKRSAPDAWGAVFDAPDGCRVEGHRTQTQSPMQALALFNSEQIRTSAMELAERCRSHTDDPVKRLFQTVLQRDASIAEREHVQHLLGKIPIKETWSEVCQIMLCLDEFVFLD